ncbi:MAG: transcriptional repressor [Maledivibacter sp.]|nr:transcriptional repressor [Maledivibacter sp.]
MINKIENIKQVLKSKGYKLTPQRRIILEAILQNQGDHLCTEQVYQYVKKDCPDIGLATVYRTLQLLEGLEIITKVNFDDGVCRYELNVNTEHHQHHHLICTKCGSIAEVKVDLLEPLEEEIEKNYNFEIKDHKVKFFGICAKCKQKS